MSEFDNKVIKKHFPRTNNDSVLVFHLEKDPNLCLEKNNISISFTVEVEDRLVLLLNV